MSAQVFYGKVYEDGTYSVLARVCSLAGAGDEVRAGEGNLLQEADVSAVTCKVYDLGTDRNADSGSEVTPAPTLVVADVIYDELQVVGWDVPGDPHGYNFRHDVSVAYTPSAARWYLLEYKLTLADGGVAWLRVKVKSLAVTQS
jgi:hypothetical protein